MLFLLVTAVSKVHGSNLSVTEDSMHASALSKHYLELARKPVNDSNFAGSQEGAKS